MIYDPFGRGPFPVGVRSGEIVDASRGDRTLQFEVWYPAAAPFFAVDLVTWTQDSFSVVPGGPVQRQAAVRDATPRDGTYPLVVYSHPSAGHRRQSSFLCTHLASHGYVVAAVDHAGNTALDFVEHARRLAHRHQPQRGSDRPDIRGADRPARTRRALPHRPVIERRLGRNHASHRCRANRSGRLELRWLDRAGYAGGR